jgi:hypothetical protein
LRWIGSVLEVIGWVFFVIAVVLTIVVLAEMADAGYSNADRVLAPAQILLSGGAPALVLVGVGRAMKVFSLHVVAQASVHVEDAAHAVAD